MRTKRISAKPPRTTIDKIHARTVAPRDFEKVVEKIDIMIRAEIKNPPINPRTGPTTGKELRTNERIKEAIPPRMVVPNAFPKVRFSIPAIRAPQNKKEEDINSPIRMNTPEIIKMNAIASITLPHMTHFLLLILI